MASEVRIGRLANGDGLHDSDEEATNENNNGDDGATQAKLAGPVKCHQ